MLCTSIFFFLINQRVFMELGHTLGLMPGMKLCEKRQNLPSLSLQPNIWSDKREQLLSS